MLDTNARLLELLRIGNLMTEIRDQDVLLERILSEARAFCNADAGSIYQTENGGLRLKYSQNTTLQKRLPPGKRLVYTTFVLPIDRSTISGYVAETGEILDIDDVYQLTPNLPYHFSADYDCLSGYRTVSMLAIPLKNGRGEIVGVLQLINATTESGEIIPFPVEERPFVQHLANQAAIALEKAELTRAIVLRMIRMAEMRDPKETGPHVNRVGAFSAALWEAWAVRHSLPEDEIGRKKDMLRIAAMLHDVGKVAISDTILKKPGKLTDEEYAVMKQHTLHGAQLFFEYRSEMDEMAAVIAFTHHENWNGRGYPGKVDMLTGDVYPQEVDPDGRPLGKSGEEIPLWGRIVKITDVYDALSRPRCYKEAWSQERVVAELHKGRGEDFDPELVDIFLENLDLMQTISNQFPDDE